MLRAHINKEDNILYPMADQLFTAEDQTALNEAFEQVEAQEMGEGVHEKYHRLAHELTKSWPLGLRSARGHPQGEIQRRAASKEGERRPKGNLVFPPCSEGDSLTALCAPSRERRMPCHGNR